MSITPQEVGSYVLPVVVSIITGFTTAWYTAKIALEKFYHEKWWEKKHNAYNQVIENLFELKDIYENASVFYEMCYQENDGVSDKPDTPVDWNKFHLLKAKVQRSYVLAPISLSKNTRSLLKEYFDKDAEAERQMIEDGVHDFVAYHDMTRHIHIIIEAIVQDAESELNFK